MSILDSFFIVGVGMMDGIYRDSDLEQKENDSETLLDALADCPHSFNPDQRVIIDHICDQLEKELDVSDDLC